MSPKLPLISHAKRPARTALVHGRRVCREAGAAPSRTRGLPVTATPPVETPTVEAPPARCEVHEWGLLRAGAGDVLEVGPTTPRAVFVEPMAVDNPVLYFDELASGPLRLERVRVEGG
jgi:hypothetical protein